jgi:serine/threonine protein phosphatase 1
MLGSLLRKTLSTSPDHPVGSPPDGTRLYAIGDIHGRNDLLMELHQAINDDAERAGAARNVIVYLGDYVDRGPESRFVIDELIDPPLPGFERVALMGNHEATMLEFLEDISAGLHWLTFGGDATLRSYGIEIPDDWPPTPSELDRLRRALVKALPADHLDFLNGLEFLHEEGDYLMVHAGVRPGISLEAQSRHDLIWIRDPFLRSKKPFGRIVVHGHTITETPELRPNRIGVDTGAFRTGCLTCVVLQDHEQGFIQTGHQ